MLTDSEIKKKGLKVLIENLGNVDAEKFVRLLSKEPFDYTAWQDVLWENKSVKQVSDQAKKYRSKE
ncbi:MAG: hypothetical protein K9I29_09520 [Bacteroidales bacterium]|nr:hypothetical protein [Bacteroidales bacterium]MCF8328517.1 hypothetical protein [Bacteroidales bacterium]